MGNLYQFPIKEELIEQGLHHRLNLGLRRYYNNPAIAQYRKVGEIVELILGLKLPRHEESFLLTYSWPKEHISDSFSFIVPIELWNIVTEMLETLGYRMEEC